LPDSARDPTKILSPGNRGQWRTVDITGDIVVARYEPRCLGYTSSNIEILPTTPRSNRPGHLSPTSYSSKQQRLKRANVCSPQPAFSCIDKKQSALLLEL